ncbi:MAG: DUF4013 domain-containing protein [Planctomycetes bacterium]|nr:DUF4013 domain-containing protein [Planctomycetota bacterium]
MGAKMAGQTIKCMACGRSLPLPSSETASPDVPQDALHARYRAALDAFKDRPRDLDGILELAEAAEALGQKSEAFLYYERLYQLEPGRAGIVTRLRACAITPDQVKKAAACVEYAPTFSHTLDDVFTYPFRGVGILLMVMGGIMFIVLSTVLRFTVPAYAGGYATYIVAACLAFAVIMGYLSSFFLSVLHTTATGADEVPQWPDITDVPAMVFDLLKFTLAHVASFLPAALVIIGMILWLVDVAAASSYGEGEAALGRMAIIVWICLPPIILLGLMGLCYLPMALLANCIFGFPLSCFNPAFIVRSIWATRGDYLICLLAYLVLYVVDTVVSFIAGLNDLVFFASVIPASIFTMYATVVQMRLLGQFYRYNQGRLGWVMDGSRVDRGRKSDADGATGDRATT